MAAMPREHISATRQLSKRDERALVDKATWPARVQGAVFQRGRGGRIAVLLAGDQRFLNPWRDAGAWAADHEGQPPGAVAGAGPHAAGDGDQARFQQARARRK